MGSSSRGDGELRSRIRSVFWNDRSRRLRMPFRIIAGLGLWVVIGVLLGEVLSTVVTGPSPIFELRTSHIGSVSIQAIDIALGATLTPVVLYLVARYVDRRWMRDFGLRIGRDWWVDLGVGFALGGLLMTAIFLVQLALGWITITGYFVVGGVPQWTFPLWFGISVLAYIVGSIAEELLYRGLLLTNFVEGFQVGPLGPRGAVAIGIALTSGFFAFAHAAAPNATTVSTLSIALAGVFLGVGYVVTGELALPIGVHIAWNFFEGNLYGFPISGTTTTSIVGIEQQGPRLLTGGAFGPEAGLFGVAAILVGIVAVVAWGRYHHGNRGLDSAVSTPELRD